MKFFITGSRGFIGSNLVKFYQNNEIFEYQKGSDISAQLRDFAPNIIINCAAEIYDAARMWDSNVVLVKDCLDYIKENPGTTMIQLGSSSEYGGVYSRATMESDSLNPVDMYAGTKGIASMLCQTYGNVHKSDVVVLRPYSPFGPGEKPHRLFPNLWRSFKLDTPMKLVNGVHDFCYIDDFISAVDTVIRSDRRKPGEILNVSSGTETTNLEVLDTFRRVTGKEGNVELVDKFVTPPVWRCDNTMIRIRYGWSPKFTLEQGIKEFLDKGLYQ